MGKWNENLVRRGKEQQARAKAEREKRITMIPDLRTLRLQQEHEARKAQAQLTSEPGKHFPLGGKNEKK